MTIAPRPTPCEPDSAEVDLEQADIGTTKPDNEDETISTVSSLKTSEVREKIDKRLADHPAQLAKVTGEEGDISRDPALAVGQSTLTFQDISFSIKLADGSSKQILAPTSGHFEPGTLVALMGPSGCGKTTLLDILAGKKTAAYEGNVRLNGRPCDHLWPRITAYVPQQDIMPANLTVKEAVIFNHRLKNQLPPRVKEDSRSKIVDMVLTDLGLYQVKDTKIGDANVRGISGGQKRRVTLARGYAAHAQIMFADEPTSGLSSTDAEACVKTMRLMAKARGITVIVVIHQPRIEVAKLFDHLMLFTSNPGRCVYNGAMSGAVSHWEAVGYPVPQFANPTDHFMDMVTPGAPGNQVDAFLKYFEENQKPSIEALVNTTIEKEGLSSLELLEQKRALFAKFAGSAPPVRNSKYAVRFTQQLSYVFRRKLILDLRNKKGILTEYITAIFKAVLMGIGFMNVGSEAAQLQLGFIYMLILVIAMSCMQSIPKLIDERTVMKMETSDALYHEMAYIISVAVINTSVTIGANLIFVVVMFLFGNMPWDIFGPLLMWAMLAFVCFDSLFSFIAALAKNSQNAQATAIPFLLLFVIYNGFTITKAGCPVFMQWAIRISPAAYAIEAMAITCQEYTVGATQEQWVRVNKVYEFEDNRDIALAVMAGLVVFFRLSQFVCLQKLNKIQK